VSWRAHAHIISDHFMKTHVVPNTFDHYQEDRSNHIAVVLGPALLYACFTPGMEHRIAPSVYNRIREAYDVVRGDHPADYNPVGKTSLHIFSIEDRIEIQDLVAADVQGQLEPAGMAMVGVGANNHDIQTMIVAVHQNTQALYEFKNEVNANFNQLRSYVSARLNQVDRNITRYAMAPVRPLNRQQQQQPQVGQEAQRRHAIGNARLGKPKTLLMLWHEYMHGLPGNKPAKDFTTAERGTVKFAYSRRKVFWDVMRDLINAGHTELSAVDLVYQTYGRNSSNTTICKLMVDDRRRFNGRSHPNLRV
jgi:hypothetical protein